MNFVSLLQRFSYTTSDIMEKKKMTRALFPKVNVQEFSSFHHKVLQLKLRRAQEKVIRIYSF